MKVVLFCGGFGMRARENDESLPKPLLHIGHRPILWHIMRYYAHFGHTDFILCLGWKAQAIKDYFRDSDSKSGKTRLDTRGPADVEHYRYEREGWNITFVDTGTRACIGERLRAVQPLVANEEMFFANYADGLTDLPLPRLADRLLDSDAVGAFVTVRPHYITLHTVDSESDGLVNSIEPMITSNVWTNGGFFAFRPDIFDYMRDGEDLVEEPFHRLIAAGKLRTVKYDGFWACMDTLKEKEKLEDMLAGGASPWAVWHAAAVDDDSDEPRDRDSTGSIAL